MLTYQFARSRVEKRVPGEDESIIRKQAAEVVSLMKEIPLEDNGLLMRARMYGDDGLRKVALPRTGRERRAKVFGFCNCVGRFQKCLCRRERRCSGWMLSFHT